MYEILKKILFFHKNVFTLNIECGIITIYIIVNYHPTVYEDIIMKEDLFSLLSEYLDTAKTAENREAIDQLNKRYSALVCEEKYGSDDRAQAFAQELFFVMEKYVAQKEKLKGLALRSKDLTDSEKEENAKVQQILDHNLLTYHFQPIVRADSGEIYSYEALMRAEGFTGISPYHILKYAELTGRLDEVERLTFLNVLRYIDAHRELFGSRLVFINSMPKVHLDDDSSSEIEQLFERLSDNVVVEMTESSEYNDEQLNDIKLKFMRLNIPIAIDDYGTGYSNISNLLRYTPNYVKIDRSLLSGIHDNPNKKHFVREIVDFCHDNGILALAEGVESSEELRTVILLGVDLIQGFYTARPAAELLTALPYNIRSEIVSHYHEREDGRRLKTFTAEKDSRVSLSKLSKDGYNCLRIGDGYSGGSVTVVGSPHIDSEIHIEIADHFKGDVVLESAGLSNIAERPCIDLNSDSEVTLVLKGNSRLIHSGIRVPPTSKLIVAGDGNLTIEPGDSDYYGIGNDNRSTHGDLVFRQDGTINITTHSHAGVLIGSGLGGVIRVERGRYVLNGNGSLNICIGAIDGDTDIDLSGCDFEAFAAGAHSVVIGSMYGNAQIHTIYSSIKCSSVSQTSVIMGSISGRHVSIVAESVNMNFEVSADTLTAFGTLIGSSDIRIDRASATVSAEGAKALLFGGLEDGTKLNLTNADISAKLLTELSEFTLAERENIFVSGGKYRIKVNNTEHNSV